MTRQRNIKTFLLLLLRKVGLICRKPRQHKYVLRIQSTYHPDERVTSIEAEQHVWMLSKLSARKNFKFDPETRTCPCGVSTIEQFAAGCKINK